MLKSIKKIIKKKNKGPVHDIATIMLINDDLEKKKALHTYIVELEAFLGFDNFSGVEKITYLTINFVRELKKNGITQYLLHHTKHTVVLTLASLKKIGAVKSFKALESVIKLIPAQVMESDDYELVEQIITSLPNSGTRRLEKYDVVFEQQFDEVENMLLKYINGHISNFTSI